MELIMEQFELDMNILHSKYERVNEDLEFLIRKCDMKYIAESGTEDDLTALYIEANEQASEKKKNIFQKMFERIKAFIQKIISKIKGKKDKIEDDKEYEVDDVSAQLSESKRLSSELKSAINSKNPEKISAVNSKIKKLMIALGIGAGAAVATTVVLKKKKMKGSELITSIDEIEKMVDDRVGEIKRISDMIDKLTDLDSVKEIEEAMRNLSYTNLDLINKLTNKKNEITDQKKAKEIERQKRMENIKELETILADDKKKDAEDMKKSKDIIKSEIELIDYTIKELDKQGNKYKDKIKKIPKDLSALKKAEIMDKLSAEDTKTLKITQSLNIVKISVERLLYIPSLKISDDDDIYEAIKLPRNEYVEKYRRSFRY